MTLPVSQHPDRLGQFRQLPDLFIQLLAEMAFADAWILGSPEESDVARGAASVACCVPFSGGASGMVVVAADPVCLTDLAAGYHSLPDEMVDDGTRLEFLAEVGALLVREMGASAGSDTRLAPGAPRLSAPGEMDRLWADPSTLKSGFGCNGDGWMAVVVRFDG